MQQSRILKFLPVAALVLALAFPQHKAQAQATDGNLTGTVLDATGAAILSLPQAKGKTDLRSPPFCKLLPHLKRD